MALTPLEIHSAINVVMRHHPRQRTYCYKQIKNIKTLLTSGRYPPPDRYFSAYDMGFDTYNNFLRSVAVSSGLVELSEFMIITKPEEYRFVTKISTRGRKALAIAKQECLWNLETHSLDISETLRHFELKMQEVNFSRSWCAKVLSIRNRSFRAIQEDIILEMMKRKTVEFKDDLLFIK